MKVTFLLPDRMENILDVLCDAFRDYPVMRHVLGGRHRVPADLRTLIRLFVAARLLRSEPVLGVSGDDGSLAGVATLTPPGERTAPEAFRALRDETWRKLGEVARSRYDAFATATAPFTVAEPHWHVNMLGVRHDVQGGGYGRTLLERAHALSSCDFQSRGVSLTTEVPGNVPLYEHFGYRVLGHARVAEGLETWGLFRKDGPPPGRAVPSK
jgi:GNAT superfamily N-acetyltransferase